MISSNDASYNHRKRNNKLKTKFFTYDVYIFFANSNSKVVS